MIAKFKKILPAMFWPRSNNFFLLKKISTRRTVRKLKEANQKMYIAIQFVYMFFGPAHLKYTSSKAVIYIASVWCVCVCVCASALENKYSPLERIHNRTHVYVHAYRHSGWTFKTTTTTTTIRQTTFWQTRNKLSKQIETYIFQPRNG